MIAATVAFWSSSGRVSLSERRYPALGTEQGGMQNGRALSDIRFFFLSRKLRELLLPHSRIEGPFRKKGSEEQNIPL